MTVLEGQPQPIQRMSLTEGWRRAWRTGDWWRHLGLFGFLFFMFLPFIITIIISFKDIHQFDQYPAGIQKTEVLNQQKSRNQGEFPRHHQ